MDAMFTLTNCSLGIIGLGYVGMPLAVAFGRQFPTIGFDLNSQRIAELRRGYDHSLEVDEKSILTAEHLRFSDAIEELAECNVYIVAVPTPIDQGKQPNLQPLESASSAIGGVLASGDIVIYESTVYPGATEEVCAPILEQESGLRLNQGFFLGYSPERINPGDRKHGLADIIKITSGSTPEVAEYVDKLYNLVVNVGTFPASSIQVAEAAKVIENTQRDVNIALVNELALIFNRLGIDTEEVLRAAGSKWNFLPFRPGLVGGHCIGVDPYYLTHKAQVVGYHPEIILAGRRLNDAMGSYIATRVIKLMLNKKINVAESKILVLGMTFKENCTDLRNTKVVDIINELSSCAAHVEVYDPWVDHDEAQRCCTVNLVTSLEPKRYDALILAVNHTEFTQFSGEKIRDLCLENAVIYDVKHILPHDIVDERL